MTCWRIACWRDSDWLKDVIEKKFKSVRIEVGETAEQFVDRFKKYLTKWREMAGFHATYEMLQNMIPRDQFFITCDKPLQTFLREKEKQTNGISLTQWVQTRLDKMLPGPTQSHVDIVIWMRTVGKDICFKCGQQGHRQFTCPNSMEKGPQKTAAMQLINESLWWELSNSSQGDAVINTEENADSVPQRVFSNESRLKKPKMSPFDDKDWDGMDVYIHRFERYYELQVWTFCPATRWLGYLFNGPP